MSSIVWIVLPNGASPTTLRASVFVAPKLTGTTLAATPFADWPATLASLNFSLTLGGISAALTRTSAAPDSALWQMLFAGSPLTPFAFKDNSDRPVWSYSVREAQAFVDGVYALADVDPTQPLPADLSAGSGLGAALGTIATASAHRRQGRRSYDRVRQNPTRSEWVRYANLEQTAVQALPEGERVMYLAGRFYDRLATTTVKDERGHLAARPRPVIPPLDFHQKLAILADHPVLLRRLGLVLDFEFPPTVPGLPAIPTTGTARFGAHQATGAPFPDSVFPQTAYLITGGELWPAPRTQWGPERTGFMNLKKADHFFVSQGEVDGDTQKLTNLAMNVALLTTKLSAEAGAITPAPPQTLPARRSTGFFIAHNERAAALKAQFDANRILETQLTPGTTPLLGAEDVLRGFRIDVRTGPTGPWLSLHRRRMDYAFGLSNPTPIESDVRSEAYVKAASGTSDATPDGPPDLYLHEIVAGWDGWSLAVPRPGRRLMPVWNTPDDALAPPDGTPRADFPLWAQPRLEPGSLPSLRFGQSYAFRVRAVDLAGNSVPRTSTSDDFASSPEVYKRQEPIAPPTLVPRWAFTEGESVEHLVIRSGEGLSAEAYATALNAQHADAAFPDKVYRGTAERHVAPPKTSQAMAETHGDFDGAFSANADRRAWFRVATREEGTFSDKRIVSLTVDDGYIEGNPNEAAIVTPPQVPHDKRRAADGGANVSSLTENRGDPLAPGEYVVCGAPAATLPYLPDSAAGGVTMWLEGTPAALLTTEWTGAWPEYKPFRLQLAEGPVPTRVVSVTLGEGRVTLPPATILTLEYSSTPAAARLGHMAYFLEHSYSAATLALGRHWRLTPRRKLVLVHAVPKPLEAPVAELLVTRGPEDTFVRHTGQLHSHSRSTGLVDLEARWDEVTDEPSRPLPNDGVSAPKEPQVGHAWQAQVTYGVDGQPLNRLEHDFGDTRHRVVRYTPVAHTRYKEYFPPALTADATKVTLAGTADGPLDDKRFSIPSSATPPMPKVVYSVPTFRWEASAGRQVRRGGGLRVYLERPWYVTGEGELLAVVLASGQGAPPADRVSHWGRDPLFSQGPAGPLALANFVGVAAQATGLALGDGSGTVNVAAWPVEFNAERRLWFCDILMDQGTAYFPFVRLALARYQPNSISGRELSAPVLADFGQLAPDRQLTFSIVRQGVSIEVRGPVGRSTADAMLSTVSARRTVPSHRVMAMVQRRRPGSVGDLGWETVGESVELPGTFDDGVGSWKGTLARPPSSSDELRVLVEEREYLVPSVRSTLGSVDAAGLSYRVVYLDFIALS